MHERWQALNQVARQRYEQERALQHSSVKARTLRPSTSRSPTARSRQRRTSVSRRSKSADGSGSSSGSSDGDGGEPPPGHRCGAYKVALVNLNRSEEGTALARQRVCFILARLLTEP
jgi:hypothetical protein